MVGWEHDVYMDGQMDEELRFVSMLQILHSIGLKFQRQVSLAEDMDSVLALHREYVTTIFDRCLLNKKVIEMAWYVAVRSSLPPFLPSLLPPPLLHPLSLPPPSVTLPPSLSLHPSVFSIVFVGIYCEGSSVKDTATDA